MGDFMAAKPAGQGGALIEKIKAGSETLNLIATSLSNRIGDFEVWLKELPGKVDAVLWNSCSDERYLFGVRFGKFRNNWQLLYSYSEINREDEADWNPLSDASLETKLLAVEHLPKLLESISSALDARTKQLVASHKNFEAFASEIGIPPRKANEDEVPF